MIIFKILMTTILYILTYYLLGLGIISVTKSKQVRMISCITLGFWAEGLLFFLFIMPLKIAKVSVHIASVAWACVWLVVMAAIIIAFRKAIAVNISKTITRVKNLSWVAGAVVLVIVAMVVYENIYGNYTDGSGARYFIGCVSTDLFTNEFGTFDTYTGAKLAVYNYQYFLQTYVHHSTVVCQLTGLNPLVEQRTVMASIVVMLSGLITWEMATAIFKKNAKQALVFWGAYQVVILLLAGSVYIPAYYIFYRSFEGKTIFGMLLVPYILTCFYKLYVNPNNTRIIASTVIALLGSYTFCMSTMYVLPFLILGFLPVSVVQKSVRQFVNFCIMMTPCVLVMVYYVLVMKGIIDLTIR